MGTQLDRVVKTLQEANPEALLAEGLEDALMGVASVWIDGERRTLAAYSMQKVIKTLMMNKEMNYEEAYDYATTNSFSANLGEHTPIFIDELKQVDMTWMGMKVRPEDMYEF
tara:strand:+ start:2676 stop:3011 length:336 start_codon:yes stop_codon:yes gene_type:complete